MRSQQTQQSKSRRRQGFELGRGGRNSVVRRLLELNGLCDPHGRRTEPPESTAAAAVDAPRALAAGAGD